MKIACFLFLERCPYELDLFVSLNCDDCLYTETMKSALSKWLRGVYIKPYSLPTPWIHTHPSNHAYQKVNGQFFPLYQMSIYFNDMNAFNMIENYAHENSINYDYVMKLRADMFDTSWPTLRSLSDETILYSVTPQCNFISHGVYKVPIVSDAWVWGKMPIMKLYCSTYIFVLKTLEKTHGNYNIHFESCVTDNVYHNKLTVKFIPITYKLDGNRRLFDTIERNAAKIPSSLHAIDISSIDRISIRPYQP